MKLFKKKDKGIYFRVPPKLKKDLDIFLAEEELSLVGFLTKVIEERKQLWNYINNESEK